MSVSRSLAFSVGLLMLPLSGRAADPPSRLDSCALAPSLSDALQRRFGSSRILKGSDLFEDERGLFNAEHRGACPGMAKGRFFGAKERPALALVVLDVDPGKTVRLVVARPAVSTWTFLEIEELAQGSTAVVSAKGFAPPAGSGSAGPARATTDSVVLTGYETWQRLYSWNGRAFEKVPSND